MNSRLLPRGLKLAFNLVNLDNIAVNQLKAFFVEVGELVKLVFFFSLGGKEEVTYLVLAEESNRLGLVLGNKKRVEVSKAGSDIFNQGELVIHKIFSLGKISNKMAFFKGSKSNSVREGILF